MDDMREIVTVEQMDRLFLTVAIVAPVVGAAVGALSARRSNPARGAKSGFLLGLLGPANLLLWKIYNALTDRMGLDTVKNLLVQLGLFVGLGVAAGLIGGYISRKRRVLPEAGGSGTGWPNDVGGGSAPVTAGGHPSGRAPGAAKTFEEAEEPPRDA